jgi:hypothetical protein
MSVVGRRLFVACLVLTAPVAAIAQEKISRAHMEACVRWSYEGGQYATRNSCDSTINVKIMALPDGQVFEGDVAPGAVFTTGPLHSSASEQMMFTACPRGYVPSLKFRKENAEPIIVSLYNCLPRERPDA